MRLLKTATKRKEKEVENEEKNPKSHIISITLLFLVLFTRGIISVVQERTQRNSSPLRIIFDFD